MDPSILQAGYDSIDNSTHLHSTEQGVSCQDLRTYNQTYPPLPHHQHDKTYPPDNLDHAFNMTTTRMPSIKISNEAELPSSAGYYSSRQHSMQIQVARDDLSLTTRDVLGLQDPRENIPLHQGTRDAIPMTRDTSSLAIPGRDNFTHQTSRDGRTISTSRDLKGVRDNLPIQGGRDDLHVQNLLNKQRDVDLLQSLDGLAYQAQLDGSVPLNTRDALFQDTRNIIDQRDSLSIAPPRDNLLLPLPKANAVMNSGASRWLTDDLLASNVDSWHKPLVTDKSMTVPNDPWHNVAEDDRLVDSTQVYLNEVEKNSFQMNLKQAPSLPYDPTLDMLPLDAAKGVPPPIPVKSGYDEGFTTARMTSSVQGPIPQFTTRDNGEYSSNLKTQSHPEHDIACIEQSEDGSFKSATKDYTEMKLPTELMSKMFGLLKEGMFCDAVILAADKEIRVSTMYSKRIIQLKYILSLLIAK